MWIFSIPVCCHVWRSRSDGWGEPFLRLLSNLITNARIPLLWPRRSRFICHSTKVCRLCHCWLTQLLRLHGASSFSVQVYIIHLCSFVRLIKLVDGSLSSLFYPPLDGWEILWVSHLQGSMKILLTFQHKRQGFQSWCQFQICVRIFVWALCVSVWADGSSTYK